MFAEGNFIMAYDQDGTKRSDARQYSNKLLIIVTKKCNRDCAFCIDRPNRKYYPDDQAFIDLATVKNILNFAKSKNIKTIALNGGEPTLHPQIVTIAKMVKEAGFLTKIFTNYDFPEVVKQLDGIIDIIRISYYGPMQLPKQKDFQSKITLKITLTKATFPKLDDLIQFVKEHQHDFYDLEIHTLMQNNDYSINAQVDYLDILNEWYPLKRNEKGDYYHDFMGFQIKREDLPNLDYDLEQKLYKAHMDGTISHYFEEDHYEIGGLDQNATLTKVLRAHRNAQYRENVKRAYETSSLDLDNIDKYLPQKQNDKLATWRGGNKECLKLVSKAVSDAEYEKLRQEPSSIKDITLGD